MSNPFDYFEEMYCINLDHRTDRWELAQEEFKSVDILDRVNRFSAIKNNDGRIGLIKSFLSIFKDVKKRGVKNVLIFEDDVKFINDPLENLSKAIKSTGNIDWMLFYLGANTHEKCIKFKPNLILLKNAFSAHAIAYNHKIYDKIIDKFEKTNEIKNMYDINDVFFCNEIQNKNISLMVNPIIATQRESYSDLEKRFVNYSYIEERFNNNIK